MNAEAKSLIEQFIIAINEEIDYIKTKDGTIQIPLKHGQFISQVGNNYCYIFVLENDLTLPDGSPIELHFKNNQVKSKNIYGQIVSIKEIQIEVALDQNLGPTVSEALLVIKSYRLLELLLKSYEDILNKQNSHLNFYSGLKVFGRYPQQEKNLNNLDLPNEYNFEQKEAINNIFKNQISFIWGPPGTGKSHTLGKITELLACKDNKKVLVLSHTHAAVDSLVKNIVETISNNHPLITEGQMIRVGEIPSDNKEFYTDNEIHIDQIIKRKTIELEQKKEILNNKLQELTSVIDQTNYFIKRDDKLKNLSSKFKNHNKEKEELEIKISQQSDSLNELQRKRKLLSEEIAKVKNSFFVFRLLKLKNLEQQQAQLNENISSLQNKISQLKNDKQNLIQTFDSISEELTQLKTEANSNPAPYSIDVCITMVDSIKTEIEPLKTELDSVIEKIKKVEETVYEDAKVICATLTKTYLSPLLQRTYDVVIIDEGSMAPLPAVFFASMLSDDKVIIGGDFRQLAPIAQARTKTVNKYLRRDIFEEAGIKLTVDSGKTDTKLVMLREQFRAHPKIADIYSNVFYNGQLTHRWDKTKFKKYEPIPSSPLVIIDTSDVEPWCSRTYSGSRFNIYHAILTGSILEQIGESSTAKVGVITPYAAQAKLLNKVIKDISISNLKDTIASTVHKFQGSERDIIIFDLTEGLKQNVGYFISQGLDSESARLINVAISRTKNKLIVLANLKHLDENLSANAILRATLKEMTKTATVIPSRDILERERISFSSLLQKTEVGEQWFYDESEYLNALLLDFEGAKKSVVFYSPFLTNRQFSNIIPYLDLLKERGIDITVVTLPPWEHRQSHMRANAEQVINDLQSKNIKVSWKSFMHEKIVLIDDHILWIGSLNWLSHNRTSEAMVRVRLKNAAPEINKLMDLNRLLRQEVPEVKKSELPQYLLRYFSSTLSYDCQECGLPMTCIMGAYGPFFICTDEECPGKKSIPAKAIQTIIDRTGATCKCGSKIIHRTYQAGAFITCENKQCKEKNINYKKFFKK